MLTMAVDRFECRLVTEVGVLLREMYDALSGLRQEVATSRVELLKWSFVFWIGQVASVAALLGLLLPRH